MHCHVETFLLRLSCNRVLTNQIGLVNVHEMKPKVKEKRSPSENTLDLSKDQKTELTSWPRPRLNKWQNL